MWTDNEVNAKLAEIEKTYQIIIQNKEKPKRKHWILRFGKEK